MSQLRVYLAGPISLGGRLSAFEVEANRSAFRRVRERLTAEGWEVLDPTAAGNVPGRSWQEWMRIGLTMMLRADALVLLAGWEKSRGAVIEHDLAVSLEIPTWVWREELPLREDFRRLLGARVVRAGEGRARR